MTPFTQKPRKKSKRMKKAGKMSPQKKKTKQKVKLGTYLPPFRDKMCRNGSADQCGALVQLHTCHHALML